MATCIIPAAAVLTALSSVFPFFASAAARAGDVQITTVAVPGGGQPVAAEMDSHGTIHLLFDSATGPQYARSSDRGKTLSPPIPVVELRSHKPELEFSAWDLAVGPEGHVHVAMSTNAWKLKMPPEEWAFFYARLDPGADVFSQVRNVNRKSSEGFSLAADDKGRVTACWLSGRLYANVSHDNGDTFAPAVEIDPAVDPCDCCTTSAAYGADGRLAVLYREETNNERDMYLVLWDQDQNATSRTRVSSTLWTIDGCPMTYFSVARDREGFVAVWPTKSQVYFTRLDGQGAIRSPIEIKTPGTTGMRTSIQALSAADGSTLVVWKKQGQLNWQLYDEQGRAAAAPASVPSAGNGVAGVSADDGQFVLFR